MNTYEGGIESVLITDRLYRRPLRQPGDRGESRAFAALTARMKRNPRLALQMVVDAARDLCNAGSAGFNALRRRPQGDYLCWKAVAGEFAEHTNVVTPRDFSPCGTALEINAAQLFHCPGRYFTYLNGLGAPVVDLLVVPIHDDDEPLGTLWVATHEPDEHKFDTGDLRILAGLADFAAAALPRVTALEATERLKPEYQSVTSRRPAEPARTRLGMLWAALNPGGQSQPGAN